MVGHGDNVGRTQASEFLFSTGKRRPIPLTIPRHHVEKGFYLVGFYCRFHLTAPNPICPSDSGGRAGFLTKLYKIEEVQIL